MITAAKLAGFFAAHAIWCVSDGDSLTPMFAYTTLGGERIMERIVNDDMESAVASGKEKLLSNESDADDAVLVYDGRITIDNETIDAIILEIRAYFSPGSETVLAIPYTPKQSGNFRVHKPKLLAWDNCDDFDMNSALESFFEGVSEHDRGSKIWNDCLDESK